MTRGERVLGTIFGALTVMGLVLLGGGWLNAGLWVALWAAGAGPEPRAILCGCMTFGVVVAAFVMAFAFTMDVIAGRRTL